MEGTEQHAGPPESARKRLMVAFKPIMLPKSRDELLKSLGAVVLERTESGETLVVAVAAENEQHALDVLQGAAGVASASRLLPATPFRDHVSED